MCLSAGNRRKGRAGFRRLCPYSAGGMADREVKEEKASWLGWNEGCALGGVGTEKAGYARRGRDVGERQEWVQAVGAALGTLRGAVQEKVDGFGVFVPTPLVEWRKRG